MRKVECWISFSVQEEKLVGTLYVTNTRQRDGKNMEGLVNGKRSRGRRRDQMTDDMYRVSREEREII